MATNKHRKTAAKKPQRRETQPAAERKEGEHLSHRLRAANDEDFEDAERDSCAVTRHRDDKVSES